MKYKPGYKYQLIENESVFTSFPPPKDIRTDFIDFLKTSEGGILTVRKYYAWDGASGPTLDTENSMTPSLMHDALYQLMREGHLDAKEYKDKADRLLQSMLKDRGMSMLRALGWYRSLYRFGAAATLPENEKPVLTAP